MKSVNLTLGFFVCGDELNNIQKLCHKVDRLLGLRIDNIQIYIFIHNNVAVLLAAVPAE